MTVRELRTEHLDYRAFLERKVVAPVTYGPAILPGPVHPLLHTRPHQPALVEWMVRGGRRACFAKFGLGKGMIQQETMRLILEHERNEGRDAVGLIIAPLGVRQEFKRDAGKLGRTLVPIRTDAEITGPGLYLTHYEAVRDGKIDVSGLTAVSLDEASVLRGFGGTKTFREFMKRFDRTPYRFVATATPSPNEYIELLAYAAFLGIMDVGEAKTRFFKRNSEKADQLTLHPHKVDEFWIWVHTWAVFLQQPSDLGFPDDGYELPPIEVRWHSVKADVSDGGTEKDGQGRLLREVSLGVVGAASEKRATLSDRVAKVRELVEASPDEHVVIWHDLEDERRAIERAIPGVVSVYGAQDLDEREDAILAFADGEIARLAAKPVMLGSGCNLQRHCARAIFAGIGFKFNDFIQAIHRIYRFLQTRQVVIDIVYADTESGVRRELEAKWKRHDEMMARMSEIIRQYGLHSPGARDRLVRTIGTTRRVERGEGWEAVCDDTVEDARGRARDSAGLIVTSIPFGTQYEYTPSYNDFGHTDDDRHFWEQMAFLSPELLRVLQPGRVMAVHVKDRIRPGGMEGLGFQTVSPFHADAIAHYRRAGFAYLGMITVATDVVRENNQTYRLGWTEQCKDGSRMGVGMPEYVLLFRKPPTDRADGYADERVVKEKTEYSRARWQIDAHGFWRSSGDRLLTPEEFVRLPADEIFRRFRDHSYTHVYDHEQMVAVGEALEAAHRLPPGFMLLQPPSTCDDVWTDVTRMRTLNGAQEAKGREMHLCPLQFDIVDRLITRYSNAGDLVYDPFGGLGTVALRALELGRRGLSVELNAQYHNDAVRYLRAAEEKISAPTLFDALETAAFDAEPDLAEGEAA